MLSSELAELAGVSVRTLRHYHKIGLLPEPPRSSAGYRHYDVAHVVRLLRITRMTSLGIPLSALPEVLDDPAAAEVMLDELDRRTTAELDRLTARRASIDALRRAGSPPDLDPELSPYRSEPTGGMSPDHIRFEHELLVLLGHALSEAAPSRIASIFGMSDQERVAGEELTGRFFALQDGASDRDVLTLIEDFTVYLRPMMSRLADMTTINSQFTELMERLSETTLNAAQLRVLRRVDQRL
ncbi:MAG: MerR family transcriptional regulator [Corynebacterium sp.]|uniref:MerR family transcriptional regulator n=1 Tax=Corynebacterium sp. TaxID=1720 RepID=UPI003F9967EC